MSTSDLQPLSYPRFVISSPARLHIAPGSSRYLALRQFDVPSTLAYVANVMRTAWQRIPGNAVRRPLKSYWSATCQRGVPDIPLVDELTIAVEDRLLNLRLVTERVTWAAGT